MTKQTARTATDANAAMLANLKPKTERPKTGVKAGLRVGESRVTCVMADDQNELLHDWAHMTGRTFREVTMAMADLYIEQVIGKFAEDGGKVKRNPDKEPPERFAHLYEDEAAADEFAKYF